MSGGASKPTTLALRTRWALRRLLRAAERAPAGPAAKPLPAMGLDFPGRLGLAAGFDRRGALWRQGHRLGFAAVDCAAPGVAAGRRTKAGRPQVVRGVSLAKPPGLPWAAAEAYFLAALRREARHADYLILNPGRERPPPAAFAQLLRAVCTARGERRLPVVVKLPAAWLAGPERLAIARDFVAAGAAGLLLSAEGAADPEGALRELAAALGEAVCLISVGGIATARTAQARLQAGARLLQLHRGLIAGGARRLAAINAALARDRAI